jgi:hypothetical protein
VVPVGVQVAPAVQVALQVPTLQTSPVPQGVASGLLPPTTQEPVVSCAEQDVVYVLQMSAVPVGVHVAFGTHAAMHALERQTWPVPHVVPSATGPATQDWAPVVASHAVR